MKIGVLASQGAFAEHIAILKRLGVEAVPVRLPEDLEVTHVNLNDNTVEGVRHRKLPIFSVQYHSEASPGPLDNMYLFDKFIKLMEGS